MHDAADVDASGGSHSDLVIGSVEDWVGAAGGVCQQDIAVRVNAELSGGGAG